MQRSVLRVDVHQHLWPEALIDALRRRNRPPRLDGWTLHTEYEAPFEIRPTDHDPAVRSRLDPDIDLILLSLSTPLGIEELPPEEAAELLDAWHGGVADAAHRYGYWAATTHLEPDLDALRDRLQRPEVVGLQISATWMRDPAALTGVLATLALCEELGRPVLVHPGPAHRTPEHRAPAVPSWWPAMVDYPTQMQAAWWAFRAAGRVELPELRICFAAGAGLAPAHHERFAVRSGQPFVVDPLVFVETSSYRRQGVDALVRALGIDTVVLGSDRPYAHPVDPHLGEAAWHAISVTNPRRLLGGHALPHPHVPGHRRGAPVATRPDAGFRPGWPTHQDGRTASTTDVTAYPVHLAHPEGHRALGHPPDPLPGDRTPTQAPPASAQPKGVSP
ncbi:MAG: amidohydrolase family protein [Actinomycetales bacterium]